MGYNMLNDISRDINNGIRKARARRPSVTTIYKWQQEWIASGADHFVPFIDYKRAKLKEYYKNKRSKK